MGFVSVATAWDDSWYMDAVVEGLRRRLAEAGHETAVELVPYGASTRALVTDLLDAKLADPDCLGGAVVGFHLRREQAARLLAHGKTVVATSVSSPHLPSVRVDDVLAGRMATGHLVALGHRSIVHVTGSAAIPQDIPMWGDRIRGYTETMLGAGLEGSTQVRRSDLTLESAQRVGHEVLTDAARPTAIFVATDELAFGVRAAARELGLAVPGDVSIISVDDHPDAAAQGMTTVRQVPSETGVAAAERILGRTEDDDQVLPLTVVDRGSTERPRARRGARGLMNRLLGRD